MRWPILMAALVAIPAPSPGGDSPRLTLDDLAPLVGRWDGSLEYLDYSDDLTRRKLGASLECKKGEGSLEIRFSYVEPNGKAVAGDPEKLTLREGGTRVLLGDETWSVAGRTIDAANDAWEVVLTRDGQDDDKPAGLRRTLAIKAETLTIRTEAKAAGAKDSLVRNEYVLKKK